MNIEVKLADKSDIGHMSQMLSRAFQDDPLMEWIWPDREARVRGVERLYAVMCANSIKNGATEFARTGAGETGAAALWEPPGKWQFSRLTELRYMPTLIRAAGRGLPRLLSVGETLKRIHPAEPAWYLSLLGSDPSVRGAGFGHAVMKSRLDRVDAEHAPAYVESSKRENIPFYERQGFKLRDEIPLAKNGPYLWAMWRNPR